jgi:DNA repair protein RadD
MVRRGEPGVARVKQAWPHQSDRIDWEHQTDLVRWTINALETNRRVCFQSPTGSGKTRIERMLIEYFRKLNMIIWIIAHRTALIEQLAGYLRASENNFSYVAPGFPMIRCKIQIGSIQTFIHRHSQMTPPDIILIDEFHHAVSPSYMALCNGYKCKIIGGTATPARRDKKPMRLMCDKIIQGPQPKELIKKNILCDFDYYQPEEISSKGLRKNSTGTEFIYDEEAESRICKKQIIGNAISHYKRYADHQPAIVSCISIRHAEFVAAQFREAGYRAQAIHSELSNDRIKQLKNGLKSGLIELLCQCDLLGEGVDIPGAVCYLWLRWTESLIIFLQGCGRVLRFLPGKRAVIIDAVGNSGRHGYPDDNRKWTLDGVENLDKGILKYKRCPSCFNGRVPKGLKTCPLCGYEWMIVERELPMERDGELVNVREAAGFELVSESFEDHKRKTIAAIAARAHTVADAIAIAREHGYENHRFGWYVWTKILRRRSA